jgi:hypothetical protein
MVFAAAFVGVTLLSGFTSAIPHPQANAVLSVVTAVPAATVVSSGAATALYVCCYFPDTTQL